MEKRIEKSAPLTATSFFVGATLFAEDGTLVSGTNFENAALG